MTSKPDARAAAQQEPLTICSQCGKRGGPEWAKCECGGSFVRAVVEDAPLDEASARLKRQTEAHWQMEDATPRTLGCCESHDRVPHEITSACYKWAVTPPHTQGED